MTRYTDLFNHLLANTTHLFMSWRAGSSMFWELWPKVKAAIPESEIRADFTRRLLTLFLDHDTDPCDLRGRDAEIDRLMDEVDPEL